MGQRTEMCVKNIRWIAGKLNVCLITHTCQSASNPNESSKSSLEGSETNACGWKPIIATREPNTINYRLIWVGFTHLQT